MITKRVVINVFVFLGIATFLVYQGATQLIFQQAGGRTLQLEFHNAAGLVPRNDVTMRGVPIGSVTNVNLTRQGLAHVEVQLEEGITVPKGTQAQINRRSPIGDVTLELVPGDGPALDNGATIPVSDSTSPPDPERTIAELARVLHSVPAPVVGSLVSELATAVRGRAQDLASLSETTADLPQRLLKVQTQLRSLIEHGPKVTGVLAANAHTLADDLTQTAVLAEILRDRRFDLVRLSQNGANFAQVANELISGEKSNLACLISNFGGINAALAQPANLSNLVGTLELNHYFFNAVWQAVQVGKDGITWFRVQLLPPQQPPGRPYAPHRPPPDIYGGNSCQSRYGPGVGPATQPGKVYVANGSTLHPGH